MNQARSTPKMGAVAPLRGLRGATTQRPPQTTAPNATDGATIRATPSLKSLAERWLERNAARNDLRNTTSETTVAAVARGPSPDEASATLFDPERAAIVEEGADVPRAWAEGFARLEAWPVPRGVTPAEWLATIDAAGRFLDEWAGKAHALGWTAGELFGLDDDAPLNRRDRRGAAFFLARAEVLVITREAITVRIGGATQSIYRRAGMGPAAWDDDK